MSVTSDDPARPEAPGGGRDPLEPSLLFEVFALNQAVGRLLVEAMRDAPLTPSEYAISSAIFELEAASPTRIAARLGMRLTTFMDQLRAFERRGFARRVVHPTDRRSYRVVLTPDGQAAQRAANRAYEAGAQAFERALGDRNDHARAALRDLRVAVEAARATMPLGPASVSEPAATPRSVGRGG